MAMDYGDSIEIFMGLRSEETIFLPSSLIRVFEVLGCIGYQSLCRGASSSVWVSPTFPGLSIESVRSNIRISPGKASQEIREYSFQKRKARRFLGDGEGR